MTSAQNAIKVKLENLLAYLDPFLPLANCHMVDFLTNSLYESHIPKGMLQEIADVGYKKALEIIFSRRESANTPNLNRFIQNSLDFSLNNSGSICLNAKSFQEKLKEWGCASVAGIKLEVFMTSKKSHEVQILSEIITALNYAAKTTHVIDIGDGKGYLSSMLALQHDLSVLGVDASVINTNGAAKRVRKLERMWRGVTKTPKQTSADIHAKSSCLYKQVTVFVTETTNFRELVHDVFLEDSKRLSLVGLHTCGDLASSSIKNFNNSESIRAICNIGCCYHLLSEEFDSVGKVGPTGNFGFPLSEFLRSRNFRLGRNARMLAAHSLDRILADRELPNKVIFYRGMLQVLLEKYTDLSNKHVGRCKKQPADFVEYVRLSLKRISAHVDVSDKALQDMHNVYKKEEEKLHIFYFLRTMLAPIIECLILLDRITFLQEQGHENSFLVQLFDPVISPRCYGLISLKGV